MIESSFSTTLVFKIMSTTQITNNGISNSQDALLAHQSAGTIRRYVFPKDTTLFDKGEARQCAYLIDKGTVHIYGNDEGGTDKLLCTLGEGEIFGEMALIDNTARTAKAITDTETEIFVIPRDSLHERVRGLDPIVSLLISLLIERYRITRIHMPESIKQDRLGDFIEKISRHENLPKDVLQLRNTTEQRETALKEMKVEQELRQAITNQEFIPVLQPILKLPEKSIVGFETLIRWQHPEKGIVMPNDFIPVAERTGVVQQLDRMMLQKACESLPHLQKRMNGNGQDLFVSVNLSGINFGTMDVVRTVGETLNKTGIDPKLIKLEITESALIGDPKLAENVLQGLKELGVTIALDDFGTGYSSLGYLHKFSIDDLKIDRSFVAQLHDGNKSIDIIRAIVGLARNFNLNIVAEGIEKEQDVTVLNELGCDMGQGYLFSKPLMIEDAYSFIENNVNEAGR